MKYGFLTTYNETIFLMQDIHQGTGESRLYYSDCISHTAEGGGNSVSLRECLLYLMILTNSTDKRDYVAKNTFTIAQWVQDYSTQYQKFDPVSPYTGHLTTPSYAQSQRLSLASSASQPQKTLPNIGSLKIKERGDIFPLIANRDRTYTTTITLDADQIENLDSKAGLPYIMIGGKRLNFDLDEQPARTKTQRPPDYGASKSKLSSFRSTQEKLFGAPANTRQTAPPTSGPVMKEMQQEPPHGKGKAPQYMGAPPTRGPTTRSMSRADPSQSFQETQQESSYGKGKAPHRTRPRPDEDDSKKDSKGGSRKPPKSGGGGLFGGGKK